MKLIVGLGNPGKEYEKTRHNVGFMILDRYVGKYNLSFDQVKFNGSFVQFNKNNEKVILLKPLSYMNLSGEVVSKFVNYFKIDISDILIINDDLDLNIGTFKLKPMGSSGGHNGLKNIELHLATDKYKRFKVGISNNKMMDTKDYVLGKFTIDEMNILDDIFDLGTNVIDDFIDMDFDKVMNNYNSMK